MTLSVSPRLRLLLLLAPLLTVWSGCVTNHSNRELTAERNPLSYAIILYLGGGTELTEEERTYALSFARDTLLASGLVSPYDRLIDDPERAELLFRARLENGQLVEVAGVPSVTNQTTVVLTELRRTNDRIWWDTSYPYGPPTYYSGIHSGFPIPGPGWGHPRRPRDYYDNHDRNRGDRDRGDRDRRDRDRRDRDDRRADPPRHGGDRSGGRDNVSTPSVSPPRNRTPTRPTFTPTQPDRTRDERPDPRSDRGVIDRAPSRPRQLN